MGAKRKGVNTEHKEVKSTEGTEKRRDSETQGADRRVGERKRTSNKQTAFGKLSGRKKGCSRSEVVNPSGIMHISVTSSVLGMATP